ncbi:hypothetical protein G5C99_002621 [Salmonella enterica]|nr:hypothetical protein [Salmonella enterica]
MVISAPGKSGSGEQAAEVAAEGKKQRHQALCLTPRLLHRRGAMSAGYGATGRRIRLRMLQAGFYASDRSVSPKPPLAGSVEPGWVRWLASGVSWPTVGRGNGIKVFR